MFEFCRQGGYPLSLTFSTQRNISGPGTLIFRIRLGARISAYIESGRLGIAVFFIVGPQFVRKFSTIKRKLSCHLHAMKACRVSIGTASGLMRRFTAALLLRLWVRIPAGAWMFVVSIVSCQVEVSATG